MSGQGNPDGPMEKFLCRDEFRGLLLAEIEILRPDLILFSTHASYDEILLSMLPQAILNRVDEDIKKVTLPGHHFRGFRTLHFQNRRFKPERILELVLAGVAH
jgi:hypothetical protein